LNRQLSAACGLSPAVFRTIVSPSAPGTSWKVRFSTSNWSSIPKTKIDDAAG